MKCIKIVQGYPQKMRLPARILIVTHFNLQIVKYKEFQVFIEGSDRQCKNRESNIVEAFLKIHLRNTKRFNDVKLLSLSAKSTFKISNLGGYALTIDFFKLLNSDDKKCKKFFSKIRCLGTMIIFRNKSILESITCFRHFIEFLILKEFVGRFL